MFGWLFGKSKTSDDTPACVACDSTDLDVLAPQAYRCLACGHEGGDGWSAWQDMQTRARYDDWSTAQLREHAEAQLNEARSVLVSVSGLRAPFPLHWDGNGDLVIAQVPNQAEAHELDMAKQVASDIDVALAKARSHAHQASLTLDALMDRGQEQLRPEHTALCALREQVCPSPVYDAIDDMLGTIRAATIQVAALSPSGTPSP